MGSKILGVPIPTLVALVLLIIGGILHIVGIATPYWYEETVTNAVVRDQKSAHHGLWVQCTAVGQDLFDCQSHGEGIRGFIIAVRAMEILALLLGTVCIIITGVWNFLHIESRRLLFMIGALGSGFLAGLFGIIGIIIYAAEVNSNSSETSLSQLYSRDLSWSFALCIVSSVLVFVATGLIGLGSRMMD